MYWHQRRIVTSLPHIFDSFSEEVAKQTHFLRKYDAPGGDYVVGKADNWQALHSDGDQVDTYVAPFVVQEHTRYNGALRIWD